ncbi:MAG TPA: DUF934 domain-containing protein [Thermohalobaculum sp.]|nr:DUF934 domain-containing protein [Thermohalobaculum sp.]
MPRLIDRDGPAEDRWTTLGADDALPASGAVIVPLDRLEEAVDAVFDSAADSGLELGVHVPNNADPLRLRAGFDRLALISVEFPAFADGRGFSLGHRLRALGFKGRLRASGHVIADQFAYLLACGFDELALRDDVAERQPVEHFLKALKRISAGYQRGIPGRRSILDARRAARQGTNAAPR